MLSMEHKTHRQNKIIKTSVIGIIVNICLVIVKTIFGILAGSIAIILDALNNLTDVVSSVVTIIGLRLSSKKPDHDHPMGHGRLEYISAIVVAIIILYAGLTALLESIKKIFDSGETIYSIYTLIMLITTIIVKFCLGFYVKNQGKKYTSPALMASGLDAINDAYVSCTVLVSAMLYFLFGIQVDSFIGVLISLCIIKSGYDLLIEDIKDILGRRADREMISKIKEYIHREKAVLEVHDLLLHNYGPEKYVGSVVVDVDSQMTADEIDEMSHRIKDSVLEEFGVMLNSIGICSQNSVSRDMKLEIIRRLSHIDNILQVHGVHIEKGSKLVSMDIIIDFDDKYPELTLDHAKMHLEEAFPDYTFDLHLDADV